MKNSWSEQLLVNEDCEKTVNGNTEVYTERVLNVCIEGQDLYRKEFVEGKYKGKAAFCLPFDFVAVAGSFCPKGKFYELEYFVGEPTGTVYRGLIQAVDPVTDLRLIVGALMAEGKLPKDLVPYKAHLRDDIDSVCIGHCTDEHDQDEKGEALFFSGHKNPKPVEGEEQNSVLDRVLKYPESGVCIEFYQGACQEVWIEGTSKFDTPDIFVCGSSNVNDPAFAEMRTQDMDEMNDYLGEALNTASDYGLRYVLLMEERKEDGTSSVNVYSNMETPDLITFTNSIVNGTDGEGNDKDDE